MDDYDRTDIRVVQYGRWWWSAYTKRGRFLAMGKTKREAAEKAMSL